MTTESTERPVHQVWSDVMQEALGLGKNQRYDGGDGGGRFNYRGIDDLMNLVGPILRKHGASIIPEVLSANYRDVMTRGGKAAREVTVRVAYTIYGPAGDRMVGISAGESMDSGDKGTAKAMSVAFRVFLLQSLCLPTDDPDPDSEVYQRSGADTPEQLAQRAADGAPGAVSVPQLEGVKRWAAERGLLDVMVNDAEGNSRTLLTLLDSRIAELAPAEAGDDKAGNVAESLGGGA